MREYLEDLLKDLEKPLDSETILVRNQRLTKYQETAQPNGQKRRSYENGQAWWLEAKTFIPKPRAASPVPETKRARR
jgi:hypothetical protein